MKLKYQDKISAFFRNSFLIAFSIFSIVSCKKFLEIPPPKTELQTTNTFSNSSTANAAILSVYSKMVNDRGFPYMLSLLTGLASDELQNYSTTPDVITFYTNNLNARNSFLYSEFWNQGYNFIYQANSILEGVNSSKELSAQLKNQLIGESKFIRAFWHFHLINLFGDIPLITTTDYSVNALGSRTSSSQVYQQIISDLKDAQSFLGENFVGVDGISQTSERVRPNKWAATALLARVYLYANDYVNAELESSKLINETNKFSLLPDPANVFLKNSLETIWALQPAASGSFSTPEGNGYILTSIPGSGYIKSSTISSSLLGAFENGDNRKTKWIGVYIDTVPTPDVSYYYPRKYKVFSGTSLTEYSIVLRIAEQYLIRAEARAQQNKISEGLQDVNKIRNRAGLNDTSATSKEQLLNIILHESQLELFSEYGHRWFDLKRSGKIDQIMNNVASQKSGTWSNYKTLFPIPQKEIDSDPNLTQNNGYQ